MRILAGDIGGTNTRLSIWQRTPSGSLQAVGEPKKFKNVGTSGLDAILDDYLKTIGDGVTDACFGVAGPVDGRRVKLTNIPQWPEVNADDIARKLKIAEPHRANLINDMPAHAASLATIESIEPGSVVTIHAGNAKPTGTQVICMPGTGLGIGSLVWEAHAKLHRPVPAEGGHCDLCSRDGATDALIVSMRKLLGVGQNVTREHLLSGPGLRSIYACLKHPSFPDVNAVPKSEDFEKLESTDAVARQTLDTFTRLLGELCGNLAFGYLATGGIYLAGSIGTSLRGRIASPLFVDAYAKSGPPQLRELIASIPVKLVTYAETGLLGAATYATWAAERRV